MNTRISNNSRDIHISRMNAKSAGFRPGARLYLVSNGSRSFHVVNKSTLQHMGGQFYPLRVENDGRIRIRKSVLSEYFGVNVRSQRPQAAVSKGRISVTG